MRYQQVEMIKLHYWSLPETYQVLCLAIRASGPRGYKFNQIETRPSRTENWAYIFFIEFHGHHQDESVKRVIKLIGENFL